MEGDNLAGSPGSELVVSAAGPLCSLLLAACFLGTLLFRPPDYLLYSFYYLSVINLIFAVFNLIPLFPMDGGRILRAILSWKTKNPLRATKIVCVLTKTMAPALVIGVYFWAGIINAVWIGVITWLFLLPAAEGEYQTILIKEKLSRVLVRDLMEQPPGVVLPFTCTERTREESTPHFCSPDETVLASIKKMKQLNAWHLWVREDDLIIGIIFAEKISKCLNE